MAVIEKPTRRDPGEIREPFPAPSIPAQPVPAQPAGNSEGKFSGRRVKEMLYASVELMAIATATYIIASAAFDLLAKAIATAGAFIGLSPGVTFAIQMGAILTVYLAFKVHI